MAANSQQIEALKFILDNSLQPERLDGHAWSRSLLANQGDKKPDASPGQRLVAAISALFIEMMPSVSPRQGKRLDTRWGEFGLLAAQYFAPILRGTPVPASLREAWGKIDQSILLFVFDKPENELSPAEKETYRLVASELEIAPHSTLSDWHRKGLQRLLQVILAREAYLAKSLSLPAVILPDGRELTETTPLVVRRQPRPGMWLRAMLALFGLLLLGALVFGGLKARKVYEQALQLRQDASALQSLMSDSDGLLERARRAGPALSSFRLGFLDLKAEVEPFLWITPWLGWVPEYGGELVESRDLLIYADSLLASADLAVKAVSPILKEENPTSLAPDRLVELLAEAGPQLAKSRTELDKALSARDRLHPDHFSARVRELLLDDLDPLTALMKDGLSIAIELPRALGASGEGPKTYLLLAQNEDELRPTGGFITAVGTVLVQDGRISSPKFVNSGSLEDWSKPYPAAPWQLIRYMNSPVLVLRDATWFTNFPTTALYAEQLYAYVSNHSVDGVIAFDQQFLVKLLRVTGPLELPGTPDPVSAENVIRYMRLSKIRGVEDNTNPNWDNKNFITTIAAALMEKIMSGEVNVEKLARQMLEALDEHSLLIQLDNPILTDYLLRRGWDGAVRPMDADFLMVADSNIGFNKTNAVVETSLDYDVDLRNLLSPSAILSVTHKNNAAEMFTCVHWGKERAEGEQDYPITDCYWNYMRVYRPAGTQLLDFAAQFIPANWMLNYRSVPPLVDVLDEEIDNVQAFGTLKVVPGGHAETTQMRFALPLTVFQMQPETGLMAYRLRVQKQPGTEAVPLQIRIHLAPGSGLYSVPQEAVVDGDTISYQTRLRTDLQFEILFYAP